MSPHALGLAMTFVANAIWQITLVAAVLALSRPWLERLPARFQFALRAFALGLCLLLPASALVGGSSSTAAVLPAGGGSAAFGFVLPAGLGRIAVLAYLVLTTFLASRLARALWRAVCARRCARSRPLPKAVSAALVRLSAGETPVLWSPATGPATVGGTILLPDRLYHQEQLPSFWLAVLGHEVAHVRRRDFQWNVLLELVSLPVGFHPAIRWMKERLDESREVACDEVVVERHVHAKDSARTLFAIASRNAAAARPTQAMAISNGRYLEGRIMRVLSGSPREKGSVSVACVLAALVAAGWFAANSAVTVRASAPPEKPARAGADELVSIDGEVTEPVPARTYRSGNNRDPFLAPTAEIHPVPIEGIGGLNVESLELRGIVETRDGFRAMVTGPDRKTYFLRGGERLYNGELLGITADGLSFRVRDRSPLRRDLERDVVVPLHPERKD